MRILSITAGAAGMYCGSCSRDNALAVELLARGHQVTLLPLYTPTNPDETNVSERRVLFGGISIYLQQYVSLFRKTPRFLDRLWDAPWLINAFASRSLSTDPAHARPAHDLDARRGSRRPAEGIREVARLDARRAGAGRDQPAEFAVDRARAAVA